MNVQRIRWAAVVLFLAALAALWALRGIYDDKEALKYIGCARDLLHGDAHDFFGRYKAYASYVIFLVPFVALDAVWMGVVAQAVLAVGAAFALARLVDRITGGRGAGTIAMVLALLCYPFQEWVLTLYTESFFASIAVLFIERVTRSGRMHWLTWALAMVLLFTRPNGILIVLPALIWRMSAGFTVPAWSRSVTYAAMLLLVLLLPGVPHEHLGVIVEGHVICGFPEHPEAMEDFHGSTIMDAQAFLFRDPAYATGLFFRRMASLFTVTRPYYSAMHNMALLPLYALFAFAIAGWWRWRTNRAAVMLASILVLYTVLIGLTYDEWNGRFLVPLWPIVFAFGGMGLHWTFQSIMRRS